MLGLVTCIEKDEIESEQSKVSHICLQTLKQKPVCEAPPSRFHYADNVRKHPQSEADTRRGGEQE